MKLMFCVLGEGRGHMTQAMAVKEMVEKAGHQVCAVVLGVGPKRVPPPFFVSAMNLPITQIPTLDFSYKNNRKVNMPATVAGIIKAQVIPATLEIMDNGRGLGTPTRSSGLTNMRRRAERQGGGLQTAVPDGGGTRLTWTASLHAGHATTEAHTS